MATYERALVTGASSGLGLGLAKRLASEGTFVVLAARRAHELHAAVGEIEASGGRAQALALDVADPDAAVRAIREVDDKLGGLDLVIANAGVGSPSPRDGFSWEGVRAVCQVNYTGAIATLTAVLPRMIERRKGHLVGVASLAAFVAIPGAASYSSTKAGLGLFLEGLARDVKKKGVSVTALYPGFVRTPLTASNKYRMPQLLELDDALDRMMAAIHARKAIFAFPEPLATLSQLGGKLPRGMREVVLGKMRR